MAGTKLGGKRAAETNKKKYGPGFYADIGKIGGKNGHTGGFYANRELAKVVGAKGGRISRRGPSNGTMQTRQLQSDRLDKESQVVNRPSLNQLGLRVKGYRALFNKVFRRQPAA